MVERRHATCYHRQRRGVQSIPERYERKTALCGVYKEANKAAKRAVAMSKEEAYYEKLYTKLDTREGAKIIYKLAKSRDRRSRDISDISYVKDED